MISVSGKKWIEKKVNKNLIEKIKQDFKFSEVVSRLIISKNYDDTEIHNIDNNLEIINVFNNNSDFNNGVELLINSIKNKENIGILGDYDVDGSTATSLLVRFFNHINQPNFYYIPDREKDGYGASKKVFKKLILKKPKLIIMVDCGSTSNEAIDFLNKNNIKSLIIDHHEINKPYPKSNILINPKKDNGYSKYNYLCATALTYFFLDILIKKIKSTYKISNFLIYVLLATVCDVMPIRKINKIIAKNVINKFQIKENIAFNILFKHNNKKNKLHLEDLGFYIGPIINSGGRLGKSNYGTELLASDNFEIVKKRSSQLIKLNNKRKEIENIILNEIDFKKIQKDNKSVIIYYNQNINEGLIGIIASRLKDYFNKPSIVLTNSQNILKGSARSTTEYNIGHLMKKLLDNHIIEKGGGHNMAAGFTIKKNNIKILEDFILCDYSKKIINLNFINSYDAKISTSAINKKFFDEIKKLGPFGYGNTLPIFFLNNLKVIKTTILNNKHISAILKPKVGSLIKSISFNSINTDVGKYLLSYKKDLNVIAEIQENIWNNKKFIQLNIKDILL
jgi:single-stranded-DNA-specific exonuclease